MQSDALTLTPEIIIDALRRVYYLVYETDPDVHYVGNGWYRVNGEVVHRTTVFEEIDRLRDMHEAHRTSKKAGLVRRLIARLRAL